MSKQNLQTLLQRIGQMVGIPDLALDDDGHCQLRLDGKLDIAIEFVEDGEQAVFTARCGAFGDHNRARVLQQIADANFYWTGSGGGTLSTNSREGMVYLQFREPTTQMDQARLEKLLQALVMNAERWAGRLADAVSDSSLAPETAPETALPGGMLASWA
ncbi:type III secretion system chaperone [Achromobacter agilis]|uniref:Uncharacterized protein n=1 Tax=Achromobacter agilis TaxID=1353888 RepID=A0A446CCX9_9BURK|nr:type III secretion system chaperone [Achromobacter agilis]SSW65718.1 hypothetical protein AGI3411_02196 [Achromobacter agilis]